MVLTEKDKFEKSKTMPETPAPVIANEAESVQDSSSATVSLKDEENPEKSEVESVKPAQKRRHKPTQIFESYKRETI